MQDLAQRLFGRIGVCVFRSRSVVNGTVQPEWVGHTSSIGFERSGDEVTRRLLQVPLSFSQQFTPFEKASERHWVADRRPVFSIQLFF